jgi:hypothetical protein
MSVLDELREVLCESAAEGQLTEREARAIIDQYGAAHPGLVELLCCFCGGPVTDKSKVRASRFVCDACAKESSDEV